MTIVEYKTTCFPFPYVRCFLLKTKRYHDINLGDITASPFLVKTMGMTAVIQYILTAAQSFGSENYYKKSRMTILGFVVVLFCENEQA